MKAKELLPLLANMEMGSVVVNKLQGHADALYHRVPGGWVLSVSGGCAFIPLNIDSVNDLRINVGQRPLSKEEYDQHTASQNQEEEKKEVEKPQISIPRNTQQVQRPEQPKDYMNVDESKKDN